MGAPHILFVDDDPDTCASVADVLSDIGYRVDVAGGAAGALALARCHPYPLALLDYRMPDMTGAELFVRIRQVRPGTVGVIVTGFAGGDTLRAGSEAGVRRALAKPVKFDEFLPLIEEAVGTPG
jgi:CheY-like chemotaxis protein